MAERRSMKAASGALAVAVAVLLAACGERSNSTQAGERGSRGGPAPATETSPGGAAGEAVEPLVSEISTGMDEPVRMVVRTAGEWRELWSRVVAGRKPAPPPPAVDFARHMVVFVGLGTRPTGGYSVEVTEVRRSADRLEVMIVERRPGRACPVTQALTSPAAAVLVPATGATVSFSVRTRVVRCP